MDATNVLATDPTWNWGTGTAAIGGIGSRILATSGGPHVLHAGPEPIRHFRRGSDGPLDVWALVLAADKQYFVPTGREPVLRGRRARAAL